MCVCVCVSVDAEEQVDDEGAVRQPGRHLEERHCAGASGRPHLLRGTDKCVFNALVDVARLDQCAFNMLIVEFVPVTVDVTRSRGYSPENERSRGTFMNKGFYDAPFF